MSVVRLSAQRGKRLDEEGWVESVVRRLNTLNQQCVHVDIKPIRFPAQKPIKEACPFDAIYCYEQRQHFISPHVAFSEH